MISIIIPAFNEAEKIAVTIKNLLNEFDKKFIKEIIIADGGSTDNTAGIATDLSAKIIKINCKSRAIQLNAGAAFATGNILFFLHADSITSSGFSQKIIDATHNNFNAGCFRLQFDYDHWFLKANAWFTRFNVKAVRFGDQGLFVTKEVFNKSGGFNEKLILMEDQEIIGRLKKYSLFKVIDDYIITSSRKYVANGIYRTQGTFFFIWLLYYLGAPQNTLLKFYRKLSR